MYSQKSAICSLNRCLHYLNEIRGLLLNAIKTLLVGKFLNALCMRLGSPVLEMQMYDQQQNTAVVVINWSCTSLWAKLLWQPASHAGKRAATAYKSALDPSVGGRRGEGGGCKECICGRWGSEQAFGLKLSQRLLWSNFNLKPSVLQLRCINIPFFTLWTYKSWCISSGICYVLTNYTVEPIKCLRLCLFWVNEIYSTNAQNK